MSRGESSQMSASCVSAGETDEAYVQGLRDAEALLEEGCLTGEEAEREKGLLAKQRSERRAGPQRGPQRRSRWVWVAARAARRENCVNTGVGTHSAGNVEGGRCASTRRSGLSAGSAAEAVFVNTGVSSISARNAKARERNFSDLVYKTGKR